MKCAYSLCKLGKEVEKEDCVKDGSRYYHKKCHHEKEMKANIRDLYYTKFKSKEPLKSVNSAIKKFINDEGYSPDYVYHCLLHKTKHLNSIFGLAYSLSYKQNLIDFNKELANKTKIEYQDIKNDIFEKDIKKVNKKDDKKWGDYF